MACFRCKRTKLKVCGEGCGLCEDIGGLCAADEPEQPTDEPDCVSPV